MKKINFAKMTLEQLESMITSGAIYNGDYIADYIFYSMTTNHTGKMERMHSISTSALCNPYCKARAALDNCICAGCYSCKQLKHQATTRAKTAKNSAFYNNVVIPARAVPCIPGAYVNGVHVFRFEAFGDLASVQQFANYATIARVNTHCRFVLWTKNPGFINKYAADGGTIPANMYIIVSSPFINRPITPEELHRKKWDTFTDATFTVWRDEKAAADHGVTINCGGRKCAACMRCYTLEHGNISAVNELYK